MTTEPKIELVTTIPGLNEIKDALPKPASKFIPDWWKNTPTVPTTFDMNTVSIGNVKVCPSFPDYFSKGFIVPMWVDSFLYYTENEDNIPEWKWKTANGQFSWSMHSKEQYLNDVPHKFFGKESHFIFKSRLPWYVFTPPGYSLYQLPPFFHFNEDFSAIPGVRDTDLYHEMNIQIVIHSKNKEIFIPRGTPLAHYIPFKRETIGLDVRYATERDNNLIAGHDLRTTTQFSALTGYKKAKKRAKDNY